MRYIAFLRALNTGKNRTVTMASIRQIFASLGFSGAVTAYTSGNVVFEAGEADSTALERMIEKGLLNGLGLDIATFVRRDAELSAIANYQPFSQQAIDGADEFNIIFLVDALDEETCQKVLALKTDADEFAFHGREIYWLRNKKPGSINFSTVPLGRAIRGPFTIRSANTVKRIAQKYVEI